MQQLPTLECTDRATGQRVALTQSLAIIEFLDEAFPEVGRRGKGMCIYTQVEKRKKKNRRPSPTS